jgi:SAM-dependent methyltransferase
MRSDEGRWWDERFGREGVIWGEGPSATAKTVLRYVPAGAKVLEVGFGYGRDLAFLVRQGYRVSGIDFSTEARRQAEARLGREGLRAEQLVTGAFENGALPEGLFDAVVSHRMAHLLVTEEAVERFADKAARVLRPGGILCLGVRNAEDLNPAEVRRAGGDVYEYTPRAGHWIRFWGDESLREAFGKAFTLLALDRVSETESRTRPVPCHLTILVARKKDGAGGGLEDPTA